MKLDTGHMDGMDDDQPIGRILSRREIVALMGQVAGGMGVVLLGGCAPGRSPGRSSTDQSTDAGTATSSASLPGCVVRPEQTEGPYFVDERLNRSDIRRDPSDGSVKSGVPLRLAFRVSQITNSCAPLPGATVDVWHCDALGVYSDVSDPSFDTTGKKFLRGYQVTDASGTAQFTTIYPGWYQGRTVHIHFKIRTASAGPAHDFTSQLYFDDTLTDRVHALAPYVSKGPRTTRNAADGIFQNGGNQLLLSLTGDNTQGYAATFSIGLQLG